MCVVLLVVVVVVVTWGTLGEWGVDRSVYVIA